MSTRSEKLASNTKSPARGSAKSRPRRCARCAIRPVRGICKVSWNLQKWRSEHRPRVVRSPGSLPRCQEAARRSRDRFLLPGTIILRLQIVLEGPLTDPQAGCQTVFAGEAEVDAAINPAVGGFVGGSGEAVETARNSGHEVRARRERHVVRAVKQRQHGGGSGAERAVTRHIVR